MTTACSDCDCVNITRELATVRAPRELPSRCMCSTMGKTTRHAPDDHPKNLIDYCFLSQVQNVHENMTETFKFWQTKRETNQPTNKQTKWKHKLLGGGKYYSWLGGSVVERRSLTGELSLSAPDLQLMGNHLYG